MAGHLATKQQQEELRKSFNQFDENGDGLIQKQEFINGYKKLFPDQDPLDVEERATEIFEKKAIRDRALRLPDANERLGIETQNRVARVFNRKYLRRDLAF